MATITTLEKIKSYKIKKLPVIILPLDDYERMKEDLDIFCSKKLSGDIKKAREEIKKKKMMSFYEVKKRLKLR